jgi:hypothetical protein
MKRRVIDGSLARLLLALACLLPLAEPLSAQNDARLPTDGWELAAWLDDRLPSSLYCELLLDGNSPGNLARRLIVYDAASGNLLRSSAGAYLIRDGEAMKVEARGGALHRISEPGAHILGDGPPATGRDLPLLHAFWLMHNPQLVTSVMPHGRAGGIEVHVRFSRQFDGAEFESGFVIDEHGAILEQWGLDADGKRVGAKKFRYDESYPRTWMILSDEHHAHNWDVERRVVSETPPPGAFTDANIARLITEADTNPDNWTIEELNAKRADDGLDPAPLTPAFQRAINRAKNTHAPWRTPLIAAGAACLILGALLWWKRRAA